MSSDNHDSILRGTYMFEALKHFNWETVMLELLEAATNASDTAKQIVPQPAEQRPLLLLSGIKAFFKIKTPAAVFSAASGIPYAVWEWF